MLKKHAYYLLFALVLTFSGLISYIAYKNLHREILNIKKNYIAMAKKEMENGDKATAYILIKKADLMGSSDETKALHGKWHYLHRDYKKAILYFKSVTDIDGKILLGLSYLKINEYDKAYLVFNPIKAENEKTYEYYLISIIGKGDYEQCLKETKAALIEYPNNISFKKYKDLLLINEISPNKKAADYLRSANWFFQNDYYKMTLHLANKTLSLTPDYREAHLLRAEAEINLKNYNGAISSLQKAKEIDPHYYWTYIRLSDIYQILGNSKLKEENLQMAHSLGYPG